MEMGLTMKLTPEEQTMSAHISDMSVVTCVYTPGKILPSTVQVSHTTVTLN